MQIRSITAFVDVTYPLESGAIASIGEALHKVRAALVEKGLEVQTTRLATQPFPAALADSGGPGKLVDLAKDLEAVAFVHEIDYVSMGPVRLGDPVAYMEAMPDALRQAESIFLGVEIANTTTGISLPRIRRTADLIRRTSTIEETGFANLRLAALANVGAGSPFFPASHHTGGAPRIAIATESADLAITAIASAASLADARSAIVRAVETEAERIEAAVQPVLAQASIGFQGIDFSLAPFPEETRSIGAALESLGLPAIGGQGSIMAAAFLTDALDRAKFTRTGFCGLMLPVLEDNVLATRAAEGHLSITELLTFSALCGTGLDTIPLPGDIDEEALSAILIDTAALALRLNKPLTARLMPLPGKQAGDETAFDFEYFAPSRVMTPRDGHLTGLLAGDEDIVIQPRPAPQKKS